MKKLRELEAEKHIQNSCFGFLWISLEGNNKCKSIVHKS